MDEVIRDSIKNNIKAIQDFIRKSKGESIYVNDEIFDSDRFGKLGEKYIMCLFDEADISKLPPKKVPSPDFKIYLNNKDYLLEVKTVKNLYKNIYQLLYELSRRKDKRSILRKIKNLLNYNLSLMPFEVHTADEKVFKKELRKLIQKIYLPLESMITLNIKCKLKNYNLSIEPENKNEKFNNCFFNQGTSLWNLLSNKKEQLGNTDILVIILANSQINEIDLLDFFYPQVELSLDSIEGSRKVTKSYHRVGDNKGLILDSVGQINRNNKILQYNYDKSIWRLKFKNKQGEFSTVDEKLKCIIVISPFDKKSLIFPSLKHFENFSQDEYIYLKKLLESKGFKFIWATHKVELYP